jgi:hypothetical protein
VQRQGGSAGTAILGNDRDRLHVSAIERVRARVNMSSVRQMRSTASGQVILDTRLLDDLIAR